MHTDKAYFIGIDIGTQGARVVMLDEQGHQLSSKEEVFALDERSREEQSPLEWWTSCMNSLKALTEEVRDHIDLNLLRAISVTSTSGTIIPLDRNNDPLHPAIMYSDQRSSAEAIVCRQAAMDAGITGYTAFNSSSGLPKMLWFINQFPLQVKEIGRFVHAADFITGRLCGRYDATDCTNALKSGFDIETATWPDYITTALPLKKEWLQQVVSSGVPLAMLNKNIAHSLELPQGVIVTSGITDGFASQIASGAVSPGDWNTTIGTTLVVKGVTCKQIDDPSGALYNHRHPQGYWMPGGASNTGADWVSRLFKDDDLNILNEASAQLTPTGLLAWPLLQDGERFPFVAPQAKGFLPEHASGALLFAACMEGVAYIERYAYQRIEDLSGERIKRVFTAGGGSQSDTWLQIRSNVLNLPLYKMKNVSGAAGAAILAASQTFYSSLSGAAEAMVAPEKTISPDAAMLPGYEMGYRQFIKELISKQIIAS